MMEKELKLLFDSGALTKAQVVYSGVHSDFVLFFILQAEKTPSYWRSSGW